MIATIDLTGMAFGRLTVLRRSGTRHSQALWHCQCTCGGEAEIIGGMLRSGRTKSCGCIKAERDKMRTANARTTSPLYRIWKAMKVRCENPNSKDFPRYGGRGIKVCERWQSFENFLADMGDRPAGMQLERSDNEKGYSPTNCCWATPRQQNRNKSTNVILEYRGQRLCLAAWAEKLGKPRTTILNRYHRGKSISEILKK